MKEIVQKTCITTCVYESINDDVDYMQTPSTDHGEELNTEITVYCSEGKVSKPTITIKSGNLNNLEFSLEELKALVKEAEELYQLINGSK